jgi:hyperosmotically inducible protein
MLPYYSVFDNLEYKVVDYRVELYGQVVWPTLKSDAASAVEHIEGVEGVDNHIEVLPLSSFDNRIRRSVYRAIYFQPAMQKYGNIPVPPIHIIVKNGHVTLVGVVDNEMDREIAFIQADGVPGVFSVTNKLRVDR